MREEKKEKELIMLKAAEKAGIACKILSDLPDGYYIYIIYNKNVDEVYLSGVRSPEYEEYDDEFNNDKEIILFKVVRGG